MRLSISDDQVNECNGSVSRNYIVEYPRPCRAVPADDIVYLSYDETVHIDRPSRSFVVHLLYNTLLYNTLLYTCCIILCCIIPVCRTVPGCDADCFLTSYGIWCRLFPHVSHCFLTYCTHTRTNTWHHGMWYDVIWCDTMSYDVTPSHLIPHLSTLWWSSIRLFS